MDPETAFSEIGPRLFAYLRRLGLSPDDSQDGVQEIFFRSLRSKIDWNSPKAYLFKIAYHIAIDWMRKPKYMALVEEIPTPFPYEDDFLSILSEEEKHIVLLVYQEQLSYEEIAGITGKPIGTLKSLVSRAKKNKGGWGGMKLENLSRIDSEEIEWQKKQPVVYKRLKLFFILHEIIQKSRFILLFLFGFWLYQPTIAIWSEKVLWQVRFLIQHLSVCVIP